ncbi:MAG: alpha/beta fold hydrolase, partial [Sphingobacteriales bacterium]
MKKEQKAMHVQVAGRLIKMLEAGTAPWQKPWNTAGLPVAKLPYNASSGNRYQAINVLNLLLSGREDPRWITFKQAEASGFRIKPGEKGTLIQFVKTTQLVTKRDANGRIVLDERNKPLKEERPVSGAIISNAWVFNAAQIDGIGPLVSLADANQNWDRADRAEQLITASKAVIKHLPGDDAYYDLRTDSITMPAKSQFDAADKYYATLLHELGHWSGHESRLDRSLFNLPGSPDYAREELRAEIASMLLGDLMGIGHDPGQHSAYVAAWIRLLTDNPFEIHKAAADAEKIVGFLLSFDQRRAELQDASAHKLQKLPSESVKKYLTTGDEIAYRGNNYLVTGHLKQGRIKVLDQSSGSHFTVSKPLGLILYFHGNTRSIKGWAKYAKDFTRYQYDVVLVDYRGFGKSTGKRSEHDMLNDMQFVYDSLAVQYTEHHIIVYGRSLGSGFAAKIASDNKPRYLILDAPYFNFAKAIKRFLPILPIRFLLRFQLRTDKWIRHVNCHTYILHGTKDRLLPISNSEQLQAINPSK